LNNNNIFKGGGLIITENQDILIKNGDKVIPCKMVPIDFNKRGIKQLKFGEDVDFHSDLHFLVYHPSLSKKEIKKFFRENNTADCVATDVYSVHLFTAKRKRELRMGDPLDFFATPLALWEKEYVYLDGYPWVIFIISPGKLYLFSDVSDEELFGLVPVSAL